MSPFVSSKDKFIQINGFSFQIGLLNVRLLVEVIASGHRRYLDDELIAQKANFDRVE